MNATAHRWSSTLFSLALFTAFALVQGCRAPDDVNNRMQHGFNVGFQIALTMPQSDGHQCESPRYDLITAASCRVGFTSYRYGQILGQSGDIIQKCHALPLRIDAVLTQYWLQPSLTPGQAQLVISTCVAGYRNVNHGNLNTHLRYLPEL